MVYFSKSTLKVRGHPSGSRLKRANLCAFLWLQFQKTVHSTHLRILAMHGSKMGLKSDFLRWWHCHMEGRDCILSQVIFMANDFLFASKWVMSVPILCIASILNRIACSFSKELVGCSWKVEGNPENICLWIRPRDLHYKIPSQPP